MDCYPSHWGLICIAICYQLLQLQRPSTNETESWTHGARAIYVTLPQRSQRVGIIEGDATLLKVKAHTKPGRQWVGEARGRGGAIAIGDGVSYTIPVAIVVVVVVLRHVDFTHPHSEEAEGWSRVQGILCSTVMATVWVVAGEKERERECSLKIENELSPWSVFHFASFFIWPLQKYLLWSVHS